MDDNDDDYIDFYEKIKDFFKHNPKVFDLDFLIFTEPQSGSGDKKKKSKPVKVHYHFEPGMDKPDVKVEGNVNEQDLNEYFKNFRFPFNPRMSESTNIKRNKAFDANKLSLEPEIIKEAPSVIEPNSEINEKENCLDLVFEAPGVEEDDVILSFSDDGLSMNFSAETNDRRYFKHVHLPSTCTFKGYQLSVNNGLVILRVNKSMNN